MTSWNDFTSAAPDLGAAVTSRFEAHLHHVMATLRADGSPRVSGTEARFFDGRMYLGSMPGARKVDDLRRDPRLALHAATIDVEMRDGDAKVSGRAIEVDAAEAKRFLSSLGADDESADAAPDGVVFAVDVESVVLTRVDGDELVIGSWTPAGGLRTIRRK